MKEGNVLFNDTIVGGGHMVKDLTDNERRISLVTFHGLLFPINSKRYVICVKHRTND